MPTEISGSTGVNKIQDNTIVNADINSSAAIAGSKLVMPTGSVLQVVEDTSTTQQAHSSASWVDTDLSLTITPRSTSSKVYLQYSFRGIHMRQNAGIAFRVLSGSTPIFTPSDGLEHYYYSTAAFNSDSNIAIDSPNTTSATTYKVQMRCYSTVTITINSGSAYKNSLIAMEIAG